MTMIRALDQLLVLDILTAVTLRHYTVHSGETPNDAASPHYNPFPNSESRRGTRSYLRP